ncbi:IclR family transcriptional regulator [Alicyclobacillus tolerans]|uniref:IclR family transcriptional regulator n=1 Tax=Alicyclobacillus tolerans TaxID=90970 RepID=UPI001F223236|nr:IclR family transcriptional regulator [Alicyclobacillus tolerans]MCF8566822.1 IclR family transcriptional regulator [Alicyclobacillus tolerans]
MDMAAKGFQPEELTSSSEKYVIEVVAKSLDILSLFDYRNSRLTLDEVAVRSGVARSTVYRILRTLESKQFLVFDKVTQRYHLGPASLRVGLIARTYDRVEQKLHWAMQELSVEYMETVNFAVLEGKSMVYAQILESPHAFRMSATVGDKLPLHTTSLGKAVLSCIDTPFELCDPKEYSRISKQLDKIRRLGYAVDDEETELGARCIGVALKDPSGAVFGGLSVSGPASRITPELTSVIGERLAEVARSIQFANDEPGQSGRTSP